MRAAPEGSAQHTTHNVGMIVVTIARVLDRVLAASMRAPSEAGGVAFACAGAFRISLQSGCMWHVSAPHRPCIGHRTGYSLHENARISGLASADFEGVFAHSYKRCRPRLFSYARCERSMAL